MAYDAFLSYSSRDRIAVARLHGILESYRPPRGAKVEKRQLHVFRYEEDQRVAHSLSDDLANRVRQVDSLILAASRSAAASEKVALEVSTFVAERGVERLFPVLVGDTIEAGMPENTKPFLRDPIWIDARIAASPWLSWMLSGKRRCVAAMLPLLAVLVGAEPDDLIARERKRRSMRRLVFTAAVLAVVAGAAGLVLRTPARAWMATDYEQIGRPIKRASIVNVSGRESFRVMSHWSQRESDDLIGRDVVMELDPSGHRTGVVGGGSTGDGMWVETKHTKEIGPTGSLTAELARITEGTPKYRTFLRPAYIEALLPSSQPRENVYPVIEMDDPRMQEALAVRAASLGLSDPASLTRCFFIEGGAELCFVEFRKPTTTLPVRINADGTRISIGAQMRGTSVFSGTFLASSKRSYYAAMLDGEDEAGYTTSVFRSENSLNWKKLKSPERGLKLIGLSVSLDENPTVAVAMSSVNFGPSQPQQVHVLTTSDDGVNWNDLTAGIPQAPYATLAGVTSDGRVAALFGNDNRDGSIAIWRPLTIGERIKGRFGLQK